MRHFFKAVGSLLLDQGVCLIASFMMPMCMAVLFNNSLAGYLIVAAVLIALYVYTAYRSGYKAGMKDPRRVPKDPNYHGYLYKGALSGLVAAAPLLVVYLIYKITSSAKAAFVFYMANYYWTWPLRGAFPSHQQLIMILAFVPMILVPWIGYIAGYKSFMFSDLAVKLYKKIVNRMPEE